MLSSVQKSIYALVRQNKINSLIYSLVVPTLVGVFAAHYSAINAVHPTLFWIPVPLFIAFAIFTAYITYDVKLAPEVYIELEKAERTAASLGSSIKFLSLLQEQSLAWTQIVRNHIKHSPKTPENFLETITEICETIVETRDAFFHMDASEHWSFALYVFDSRDGLLHPVWRAKHRRHPSIGLGRSWAPGRGHVGIAFAQKEPKICPDASAPGVWEAFNTDGDARDYDRTTYASFVSEPIGPVDEKSAPFGALVATSNKTGRFDLETALVLRHAASAIATLISIGYGDSVLHQIRDIVASKTRGG